MEGVVYDVFYDYYDYSSADDAQLAVALSIFSLIMGGLAWLILEIFNINSNLFQ